jgi:hypothetical protein
LNRALVVLLTVVVALVLLWLAYRGGFFLGAH